MVTLKDFASQLKPEERIPEYENDPDTFFYKELLPLDDGGLQEVPVLLSLMEDGADVILIAFGPNIRDFPRAKVLALLDPYTLRTPFYSFFVKNCICVFYLKSFLFAKIKPKNMNGFPR